MMPNKHFYRISSNYREFYIADRGKDIVFQPSTYLDLERFQEFVGTRMKFPKYVATKELEIYLFQNRKLLIRGQRAPYDVEYSFSKKRWQGIKWEKIKVAFIKALTAGETYLINDGGDSYYRYIVEEEDMITFFPHCKENLKLFEKFMKIKVDLSVKSTVSIVNTYYPFLLIVFRVLRAGQIFCNASQLQSLKMQNFYIIPEKGKGGSPYINWTTFKEKFKKEMLKGKKVYDG